MVYILKNKEVLIGDTINVSGRTVVLTEDIASLLLSMGLIEEKAKTITPEHKDLSYYINSLARRNNLHIDKAYSFFETLALFPGELVAILLKEIALDFDSKHKSHIKYSPSIYSINRLNGKIIELNRSKIKSYSYFAAFRTKEEAYKARSILKPFFEDMY